MAMLQAKRLRLRQVLPQMAMRTLEGKRVRPQQLRPRQAMMTRETRRVILLQSRPQSNLTLMRTPRSPRSLLSLWGLQDQCRQTTVLCRGFLPCPRAARSRNRAAPTVNAVDGQVFDARILQAPST